MSPESYLAFALDFPSYALAESTLHSVAPFIGCAKIGLELFLREGASVVQQVRKQQIDVFLDLKLHDIPATVERAVAIAASMDVRLLTVHASGGRAMLEAAARRAQRENPAMRLVAVTVLTSLDTPSLNEIGVASSPKQQALRLADVAWSSGIRSFVCSPHEVAALRTQLGPDALLVTPGVRPATGTNDDQRRVATPSDAIRSGSNLLVVGRPIRDAKHPRGAAQAIRDEIASVISSS